MDLIELKKQQVRYQTVITAARQNSSDQEGLKMVSLNINMRLAFLIHYMCVNVLKYY